MSSLQSNGPEGFFKAPTVGRSTLMPGRYRLTTDISQATKPLPRLPRGWSRVCHETGIFLRSIGLGIVVTAFQGFFTTKNFSEPEKIAVRRSRLTALLKTLIHLLPLGIAIFEIFLNWKGHYVGSTFDKQNYLQVAAKAHEITIHASTATILLSYIRYEITFNNGIPFGAVLGGLQFLQPSYLWSVEFWSSILCKQFQFKKKICFLGLVSICVLLAAIVGPSSANLLIARQGLWPKNSTYLILNATFQDIWPDRLDTEKILKNCTLTNPDAEKFVPGCPLSTLKVDSLRSSLYAMDAIALNNNVSVMLPAESVDRNYHSTIETSHCPASPFDQSCATTPQAAVMPGFSSYSTYLAYDQRSALESYQIMKDNYYQPYTVVNCVTDVHSSNSDQTPLRFARMLGNVSNHGEDQEIVPVSNLTKHQAISSLDNSQFCIGWVELPQNIFDTGVPGIVIAHPRNSTDLSHNITTCTLNAGWGSSALMTDWHWLETASSRMYKVPSFWPAQSVSKDSYGYVAQGMPDFAKISNFSYPQRRISISKGWMESLNPTVIFPENVTATALPLLLSQLPHPNAISIQYLLNILLVTALSNSGAEYEWKFSNHLTDATTYNNLVALKMEQSFYGWGYTAQATATKLAIAVMMTYCILVFGHIIYSAISGISSSAWDSIAELVTLTMNSSPTEILQNTCAGVVGRKVFQTNVRVLQTTDKHLEMVFGDLKYPNVDTFKLTANEKYGTLTVAEEHDAKPLKTTKTE